ncbi:MAG: hypothetical protein ACTSRU_11010 [Candidatus Hodarchaeales archaeon]
MTENNQDVLVPVKKKKLYLDWKIIIPLAIEEAQNFVNEIGDPPTLRGLYYRLVSRNAIPNIQKVYKNLSAKLARARKDGVFPWHLLMDKTRQTVGGDSGWDLDRIDTKSQAEAKTLIASLLYYLRKVNDGKVTEGNYNVLKWERQPKRVIICVEKDALEKPLENFTRGLGISTIVMRGYASTTAMKDLADTVRRYNREDLTVEILLMTDYDPSGKDIARHVGDELRNQFFVYCNTEEIMLNKNHIVEFDLPPIPENADEIAKLQRDPRFNKWEDGLYRVELDAMLSYTDDMRQIVRESVLKHYDTDIEDEVKEEVEALREQGLERMKNLKEMFGDEEIVDLMDRLEAIYVDLEDDDE